MSDHSVTYFASCMHQVLHLANTVQIRIQFYCSRWFYCYFFCSRHHIWQTQYIDQHMVLLQQVISLLFILQHMLYLANTVQISIWSYCSRWIHVYFSCSMHHTRLTQYRLAWSYCSRWIHIYFSCSRHHTRLTQYRLAWSYCSRWFHCYFSCSICYTWLTQYISAYGLTAMGGFTVISPAASTTPG